MYTHFTVFCVCIYIYIYIYIYTYIKHNYMKHRMENKYKNQPVARPIHTHKKKTKHHNNIYIIRL